MVYGRKPTGIILYALWSRDYFIYYPPGKKSRRPLANRLFFTKTTMATGLWLIQCICSFMVLGYFISICNHWHRHVCVSAVITKDIDHWCCSFTVTDDSKRKCGCLPPAAGDR